MNTSILIVALCILATLSEAQNPASVNPRIVISSDIGGTDPDDFQSMIHLLMYADLFKIEGLISSPYGAGRKEHILEMIDLYAQDFKKLRRQAPDLPNPKSLRKICKQGAMTSSTKKRTNRQRKGQPLTDRINYKNAIQLVI